MRCYLDSQITIRRILGVEINFFRIIWKGAPAEREGYPSKDPITGSFEGDGGVAAAPQFSQTRYEIFREIPGSFTRFITRLQREQMMVCQTKRFGVFHVPMKFHSL